MSRQTSRLSKRCRSGCRGDTVTDCSSARLPALWSANILSVVLHNLLFVYVFDSRVLCHVVARSRKFATSWQIDFTHSGASSTIESILPIMPDPTRWEHGDGTRSRLCRSNARPHGRNPDRILPVLQVLQRHYRYLPSEALRRVAQESNITLAQIASVSTFYSQFRHRPVGRNLISVCNGTACHVKVPSGSTTCSAIISASPAMTIPTPPESIPSRRCSASVAAPWHGGALRRRRLRPSDHRRDPRIDSPDPGAPAPRPTACRAGAGRRRPVPRPNQDLPRFLLPGGASTAPSAPWSKPSARPACR